jgi:PKD repeat protein
VEADFVSVTNGLVVNFTDETVGPNINGWSWDFGDGNSSTESDPTHAYASEGSYSVCLVSNSDCNSDTICQTVVVSMVSVAEDGVDFGLHIYPNPSVGQFTVELDALNEDVTAHVTDVAGRVLSTCVIPMNVTKKNFSLDLSAGTYLIRFNTQSAVVVRKLQMTP